MDLGVIDTPTICFLQGSNSLLKEIHNTLRIFIAYKTRSKLQKIIRDNLFRIISVGMVGIELKNRTLGQKIFLDVRWFFFNKYFIIDLYKRRKYFFKGNLVVGPKELQIKIPFARFKDVN